MGHASSTTGATHGVMGTTVSPDGVCVYGKSEATTGATTGVRGEVYSADDRSTAVFGEAFATSGTTFAVRGTNHSDGGWGVAGEFPGTTGDGIAVIGTTHSAEGTAGVFYNVAGGTLLRGWTGDPATEVFTLDSSGNVYATGGLSVDSGTLVVDAANHRVGIGTATPSNILTVVQDSATDPIADAWTTYSSRRWKTNIQTLQGALGKVERLRGVSYDAKADSQHNIGLIAEEVGEVVPEVVAYEANGKDAKSVDYARLTALLIEAVKEQQAQIQTLKSEIERLTARLEGGVETASR
jgi:uncharacterized small protein (DUF1192 family)